MKEINVILNNQAAFLRFLKSKFPVFHNSNLFFRDIQYGIMWFLQEHNLNGSYPVAEKVAKEVVITFEQNGTFTKIDHQTWMLNYPEFALPRIEKKAKA